MLLRLRDSDLWGEKGATAPGRVARVVVDSAWRRRGARVAGTWDAPFVTLFSRLPDALKDAHFSRVLGLRRPKRRAGR